MKSLEFCVLGVCVKANVQSCQNGSAFFHISVYNRTVFLAYLVIMWSRQCLEFTDSIFIFIFPCSISQWVHFMLARQVSVCLAFLFVCFCFWILNSHTWKADYKIWECQYDAGIWPVLYKSQDAEFVFKIEKNSLFWILDNSDKAARTELSATATLFFYSVHFSSITIRIISISKIQVC